MSLYFTWTATGNYPAGPNAWNGQPLAVAPATTVFTPNQKPPAEVLNYEFGKIATDLASLYTQITGSSAKQTFTANGSFTVPANVNALVYDGCGGGGGGQGSNAGGTGSTTGNVFCLGGGGAGAPHCTGVIPVTPGDTLTIVVGAGGAHGSAGSHGGDGAATTVTSAAHGLLVTLPGGCGAGSSFAGLTAVQTAFQIPFPIPGVNNWQVAPGGTGVNNNYPFALPDRPLPFQTYTIQGGSVAPTLLVNIGGSYTTNVGDMLSRIPGSGGCSAVNPYLDTTYLQLSSPGIPSTMGFAGGAAGTWGGAMVSSGGTFYPGGAGGGGGGGGPFGVGGSGGAGGAPSSTAAGGNGSSGAAAAANTGAGGGGGGNGGWGTSGGNAASGGAGGSGLLILAWVGPGQ